MTASSHAEDRSHQQLWPIPAQMHQYIDGWLAYVRELERRIEVLRETSRVNESAYTEKIEKLRLELVAMEKPLLEQITVLERANVQLKMNNDSLREDLNSAVQLLAVALEQSPKTASLPGMINEAVLLIEEAKQQLRESL